MVKDKVINKAQKQEHGGTQEARNKYSNPEGKKEPTQTLRSQKTYPRIMCLMLKAEGKRKQLEAEYDSLRQRKSRSTKTETSLTGPPFVIPIKLAIDQAGWVQL